MTSYNVRIDACFNYEVEADSEEEAQDKAEELFGEDDAGSGRITETIVFGGDDDDD